MVGASTLPELSEWTFYGGVGLNFALGKVSTPPPPVAAKIISNDFILY